MVVSLTPVAKSVPFDNSTNGFTATDTQAGIEEAKAAVNTSASPGFSFGRSGVATAGTFLQCESVPSNISGRWVYIGNAAVKKVFVSNETSTTYKIDILSHDGSGANLTSLGTITVTSALGGAFDVDWAVATSKQIAVRVATDSANAPKNIVCGLELRGTT
jgi:hypothetical protein